MAGVAAVVECSEDGDLHVLTPTSAAKWSPIPHVVPKRRGVQLDEDELDLGNAFQEPNGPNQTATFARPSGFIGSAATCQAIERSSAIVCRASRRSRSITRQRRMRY